METSELKSITVQAREGTGKSVTRKLRAAGTIPAVVYGRDLEPRALQVSPDDIVKLFEGPKRKNVVFHLELEGGDRVENVMVKTYQVSPVRRDLLHVDFIAVSLEKPIRVQVPIEAIGRSKGERLGAILNRVRPDIDIWARPLEIPTAIEVDVSELGPGESVVASDAVLPEGVEPAFKANYGLFRVMMPRKKAAQAAAPVEGVAPPPAAV